jgi:hypothetical protein
MISSKIVAAAMRAALRRHPVCRCPQQQEVTPPELGIRWSADSQILGVIGDLAAFEYADHQVSPEPHRGNVHTRKRNRLAELRGA